MVISIENVLRKSPRSASVTLAPLVVTLASFTRFRFSSVSNLTFAGLAPDGEVVAGVPARMTRVLTEWP